MREWLKAAPCVVSRVFWMPATNGPRSKREAASAGVGRQQAACPCGASRLNLAQLNLANTESLVDSWWSTRPENPLSVTTRFTVEVKLLKLPGPFGSG